MSSRKFRIGIATINFAGYCTAIGFAWYLDPRLPSHVDGPRSHPYALYWLVVSLAVSLSTYFLLSPRVCGASGWRKLAASFLPLLLGGAIASLFGFPPEHPHVGILISTCSFCAISVSTVWLRIVADEVTFINDGGVPYDARLERLKATVTTWQLIAVYSAITIPAIVAAWLTLLHTFASYFVTDKQDQFTLERGEILQVLLIASFVILGPLQESFRNVFKSLKHFSKIKRDIRT